MGEGPTQRGSHEWVSCGGTGALELARRAGVYEEKVDDQDCVLHVCVKYNHLEVLKLVLGSISDDDEVLKMTDSCGDTVLHLAMMLKQIEISSIVYI